MDPSGVSFLSSCTNTLNHFISSFTIHVRHTNYLLLTGNPLVPAEIAEDDSKLD